MQREFILKDAIPKYFLKSREDFVYLEAAEEDDLESDDSDASSDSDGETN